MADSAGRIVNSKVYIEGHLIPHTNVSITIYDGQTSVCTIDTTPIDATKRIPAMSSVLVLYYDDNFGKWCVLWEGFYTGWQFSKTPTSRSIALRALDWTGLYQKIHSLFKGSLNKADDSVLFDIYSMGVTSPVSFGKEAKGIRDARLDELREKIKDPLFLDSRYNMNLTKIVTLIVKRNLDNLSFTGLTEDLIETMLWFNPLVYYRYIKSGMKRKFASISDAKFKEFYDAELLKNSLLNTSMANFNSPGDTFDKLLAHWEAVGFYSRSTLCAPPFVNEQLSLKSGEKIKDRKAMYQFIYHPRMFLNVPPACNTLFPELIDSISYSRNYLAEATRIMTRAKITSTSLDDVTSGFFFSERVGLQDATTILNQMQGISQNSFLSHFSAEEYEQYITPVNEILNGAEYNALSGLAKSLVPAGKPGDPTDEEVAERKKKLQKLLGATTHYSYVEKKYGKRPVTITGSFNPYFVVGFPCTIFDEANSFMAKPLSVTHNINASGQATTQYICNFGIDFDKDDLTPPSKTNIHSKFPPLPGYAPDGYQPENIDETYASLLGRNKHGHAALAGFGSEGFEELSKNAIINLDIAGSDINPESETPDTGDTGIGTRRVNVAMIANSIFNIDRSGDLQGTYDKVDDKIAYARQYVLRSVTSVSQYMEFYNMSSVSDQPPDKAFPESDVYKHIVNIRESSDPKEQGVLALVDQDFLGQGKTPEEYLDEIAKIAEAGGGTGRSTVTVEFVKYRKMADIQKAMMKTGFKG